MPASIVNRSRQSLPDCGALTVGFSRRTNGGSLWRGSATRSRVGFFRFSAQTGFAPQSQTDLAIHERFRQCGLRGPSPRLSRSFHVGLKEACFVYAIGRFRGEDNSIFLDADCVKMRLCGKFFVCSSQERRQDFCRIGSSCQNLSSLLEQSTMTTQQPWRRILTEHAIPSRDWKAIKELTYNGTRPSNALLATAHVGNYAAAISSILIELSKEVKISFPEK